MAEFIDYFRQGRADKQAREERKQLRRFGELAGSLGTVQDRAPIMAEMSQLNPERALQFGKFYQDQDAQAAKVGQDQEKQNALMNLRRAQVLLTAPPEQRLAIYKQHAPDDYAQAVQSMGREPTVEELTQMVGMYAAELSARTGEAMPTTQQPKRDIREVGGNLVDVTDPNKPRPVYNAPAKPPGAQFVALTPKEVSAAGLPPGTAAQRDTSTGKIDVISKRDNTGVLTQKDATTAKMKLNTVALARKQLEDIRSAFLGAKDQSTGKRSGGIKGTYSAGPVQGYSPTEGGQKFDAAVDQMRSTLTALTRVPGVGAMSDYETKLDQAKFPSRLRYEAVTEQQIQALEDQLALIENGYRGLLDGGSPQEAQQQGPVRVSSPQEAMALPPGTQFMTPDGRVKVRP